MIIVHKHGDGMIGSNHLHQINLFLKIFLILIIFVFSWKYVAKTQIGNTEDEKERGGTTFPKLPRWS